MKKKTLALIIISSLVASLSFVIAAGSSSGGSSGGNSVGSSTELTFAVGPYEVTCQVLGGLLNVYP